MLLITNFFVGPLVCKYDTDLSLTLSLKSVGRDTKTITGRACRHLDHEYGFTNADRELFVKLYGRYSDSYTWFIKIGLVKIMGD